MQFSSQTTTLVDAVERHAQRRFTHRDDVAFLIELAFQNDKRSLLDELSFVAKFAHKTYGIMKRIGNGGEGYDKLSKEFADAVEKSQSLLHILLGHAESDAREKFQALFLAPTSAAFQNLLTLFHDLSRYKNYLIDTNAPASR